jgi:hypothetical protein
MGEPMSGDEDLPLATFAEGQQKKPLVASDTMETLWLEGGFLFHINGIPVLTTSTTVVKTTAGNCALIKKFIEKRTKPSAEGQQGEAGR